MTETHGSIPLSDDPEVSVVFPCLNEAETIVDCIRAAWDALERAGLRGEIIVADNGSTDGSSELALAAGAIVVKVQEPGYGNALRGGLRAASAPHCIFLDADLSYDPADIPRFLEALRNGADLVIGSRMHGVIEPGAMPGSHRYFGTPALTMTANLLFRCGISDINCGMRGISREALHKLGLGAEGMEFASEMLIKAAHQRLHIREIPIDFRRDQRNRPPHLRSFRDGWRHLQLMLHYAPLWLYFLPGFLGMLTGFALILFGVYCWGPIGGSLAALVGLIAISAGTQIVLLGLTAQDRIAHPRWHSDARLFRIVQIFHKIMVLETGLLFSLAAIGMGVLGLLYAVFQAKQAGPEVSAATDVLRWAFLSGALILLGIQVFFTCAFLGLFGRQGTITAPQSPESQDRTPE